MAVKVFIDGAAGTTGLEIRERLQGHGRIELVTLDDKRRKESAAREDALNGADVVILCLPDDAARDAVAMIRSNTVRVIDASSAHRVAPGWTYGFPEMEPDQTERIASANRVSNPGCYPTGFLGLVRPLTRAGIVPSDFPVTVNAVSGYSGGGKAMIDEFERKDSPSYVETVVRTYALTLSHKHVPEMTAHARLAHPPVFAPNVGRFYRGMVVEVPIQLWALPKKTTAKDIHAAISDAYRGRPLVEIASLEESAALKTLDAEALKNTNKMKLYVFGNDKTEQVRLVAVLDNLGKGAAGACVQNLNIMLGSPEDAGLM